MTFANHCLAKHCRTCRMTFILSLKVVFVPSDRQLTNVLCHTHTHTTLSLTEVFTAASRRIWNSLTPSLRAQDLNYDQTFFKSTTALCDHIVLFRYLLILTLRSVNVWFHTVHRLIEFLKINLILHSRKLRIQYIFSVIKFCGYIYFFTSRNLKQCSLIWAILNIVHPQGCARKP